MPDLFADIDFEGDYDDEMFAGIWDSLPAMCRAPGQAEGSAVRPPPAPTHYPIGQRFPYHIPPPMINQQIKVEDQAGSGQIQHFALEAAPAQQNMQSLAFGWNEGPRPVGFQLMPDMPRRIPPAAKLGFRPEEPPMAFNHEAVFGGQQQGVEELQDDFANVQQMANVTPIRQPGTVPTQQMMQEVERLRLQADVLPWVPNGRVDAQQGDVMAGAAAVHRGKGRVAKYVGRAGGALNPANWEG